MTRQLLTTSQTAELLQRTVPWVQAAAKTGDIPASRIGGRWRFDPDELDRWLLSLRPVPRTDGRPSFQITPLSAKRQATKRARQRGLTA